MTGKKRGKKMKPVKAWGGFTDGKLDWLWLPYGDEMKRGFATFKTKKAARNCYEDVRRVLISEIPSGRGK